MAVIPRPCTIYLRYMSNIVDKKIAQENYNEMVDNSHTCSLKFYNMKKYLLFSMTIVFYRLLIVDLYVVVI